MELKELEKIDSKHMFKTYDRWPEIAIESYEKDYDKIDIKDIDHVVFAGMGGSGSIGDTISAILSKKDIHVSIVKGYLLPKTVDSKTLVIGTSVSGNTAEVLTILRDAKKTNSKENTYRNRFELACIDGPVFDPSHPCRPQLIPARQTRTCHLKLLPYNVIADWMFVCFHNSTYGTILRIQVSIFHTTLQKLRELHRGRSHLSHP